MSSDEFSLRCSDLVIGSYDCVDRIVLNAFFPLGHHHQDVGASAVRSSSTATKYVAGQAAAAGITLSKVGNCFTAVADVAGLARLADALSQDATVGRLSQVCRRWIYSACLCFGLDLDEQQKAASSTGSRSISSSTAAT